MTVELSQERSDALVAANYEMLLRLVRIRKDARIRQEDVAAALGVSQQAVSQFERLERDPHLSTVAQYANAVGALIEHTVVPDCAPARETTAWSRMTVSFSTPTAVARASDSVAVSPALDSKRTDFAMAA